MDVQMAPFGLPLLLLGILVVAHQKVLEVSRGMVLVPLVWWEGILIEKMDCLQGATPLLEVSKRLAFVVWTSLDELVLFRRDHFCVNHFMSVIFVSGGYFP